MLPYHIDEHRYYNLNLKITLLHCIQRLAIYFLRKELFEASYVFYGFCKLCLIYDLFLAYNRCLLLLSAPNWEHSMDRLESR